MPRQLLMIVAAGCLLAADTPRVKLSEDDQKTLEGAWTVVSAEREGKPFADPVKATVTFAGDKITVMLTDGKSSKGTYKLDSSKKPRTIDVTSVEGSEKGKTMPGIYELTDAGLKICIVDHGNGGRPTEFKSTNPRIVVLVLKRDRE